MRQHGGIRPHLLYSLIPLTCFQSQFFLEWCHTRLCVVLWVTLSLMSECSTAPQSLHTGITQYLLKRLWMIIFLLCTESNNYKHITVNVIIWSLLWGKNKTACSCYSTIWSGEYYVLSTLHIRNNLWLIFSSQKHYFPSYYSRNLSLDQNLIYCSVCVLSWLWLWRCHVVKVHIEGCHISDSCNTSHFETSLSWNAFRTDTYVCVCVCVSVAVLV